MSAFRLDHIAFGVERIADAAPVLVGELGGRLKDGGPSSGFTGAQWSFRDGERLELIEPRGDDGFLHRFLRLRGSGVHHATFKVPDLRAAADRARTFDYDVVGFDDSSPYWKEAFLHPKQALGIVVQFAEAHPRPPGEDDWSANWAAPPCPPPAEPATRIVGLRMTCRSAVAARRQWAECLGARETRDGDRLCFEWDDSPLRIAVRVDANRPDGPEAIEIRAERPSALVGTVHPALGLAFEIVA